MVPSRQTKIGSAIVIVCTVVTLVFCKCSNEAADPGQLFAYGADMFIDSLTGTMKLHLDRVNETHKEEGTAFYLMADTTYTRAVFVSHDTNFVVLYDNGKEYWFVQQAAVGAKR